MLLDTLVRFGKRLPVPDQDQNSLVGWSSLFREMQAFQHSSSVSYHCFLIMARCIWKWWCFCFYTAVSLRLQTATYPPNGWLVGHLNLLPLSQVCVDHNINYGIFVCTWWRRKKHYSAFNWQDSPRYAIEQKDRRPGGWGRCLAVVQILLCPFNCSSSQFVANPVLKQRAPF